MIQIDHKRRQVRFKDAQVELTKMEFDLLSVLVEYADQVFSREELLDKVWGYASCPTTRTVDTHVLQLRQKFAPSLFETIRGVGYRYNSRADINERLTEA